MEIKNNNIQPKKTIFNGNSFELLYSNPNLEIIKGNLKANTLFSGSGTASDPYIVVS